MNTLEERFPIPLVPRIALSSISIFIGWCCAFLALLLIFVEEDGYITDFEFLLFYPAVYVFMGWLFFVVPVVSQVDHRRLMFRPDHSVVFGAGYGVLAFVILTGITGLWVLWVNLYYVSFAAIVGTVMLVVYSIAIRSTQIQGLARKPYFSMSTFSIPVASVLCFSLLIWPAVERLLPAVTYRYGSPRARNRIEERVIRSIKVGDKLEDLQAKLPDKFGSGHSFSGYRGDGFSYSISFKDDRVASVQIKNKDWGRK